MLTLTRRPGDSVDLLVDGIVIATVEVAYMRGSAVRIRFNAPGIQVVRSEVRREKDEHRSGEEGCCGGQDHVARVSRRQGRDGAGGALRATVARVLSDRAGADAAAADGVRGNGAAIKVCGTSLHHQE